MNSFQEAARYLILWGLLFLLSCQPVPAANETPVETAPGSFVELPSETVSPTPGESEMTRALPTPADPALQNLIEITSQDLANWISVPPDEITVVEATAVEWSDSSLGCPQQGMSYLQVITPGYRIVLRVNNQTFTYHTNRNGYFVYCTDPLPPVFQQPEK